MSRRADAWTTQQLIEFVAGVATAASEAVALRDGLTAVADALDADVAAVVRDGRVTASVGWPDGATPAAALLSVAETGGGTVEIPGGGGAAAVVIELGGEPGSWVILARRARPSLDAGESGLLRAMAQTLALALRSLRSAEVLRQRRRLLEGVAEIQRAITRRAPVSDVLDGAVDLAAELLGDELSALLLRDPDRPEELVIEAHRGIDDETLALVRRRRVGDGVAGRAVAEDRLVAVEDYAVTGAIQLFRDRALQAAMAAPVRENNQVVGALLVSSWRPGRRYDDEARDMLMAIAEHVGLALTDARAINAMVHQAMHDALTGLPNRALFLDRLEHALARAVRVDSEVAVLFLDLDRFKAVNDSLGHAAGDELLCGVARRIGACMRAADTAARLGGDEFAVLLEDVVGTREAIAVAERVIAALEAPIEVAGREVIAGASIGIATGASGAADLLRHADVAMYRAKSSGAGGYEVFEEGMQARVIDRVELEDDLERAIDRGELELHYQPILSLSSGAIAGHEALVRWRHPTRGLLAPAAFIPVAEESGLILSIGRFVLQEACRQAAVWARRHGDALTMAVNVSGRQLEDPGLAQDVTAALRETGLAAGRLVLEITESVLMRDDDTAIERARALRALGVLLALDDFGTGSSLRFINRFPLDILKTARPIVDGLGRQDEDPTLARAIIELGTGLGLTIVAGGIERSSQLRELRRLGCPLGQGYWFAQPMTAAAAEQQLLAPPSTLL